MNKMGCKASRQTIDPASLEAPNLVGTNSGSGNGTDVVSGVTNGGDGEYNEARSDSEVLFRPPIALFEQTGTTSSSPFSSRMVRNRLSSRTGRLGGANTGSFSLAVDPYDEGDNLNQLRSEMMTLERMFQTLLESQRSGSSLESNRTGYPPASTRTIKNLPTIVVSKRDLEDGCNKECSVCFLEFNVNDKVSRLQCGHFFHPECVNEWLQKKCTCPICRWELETEDQLFEVDRIERMKSRKIRVKDHELDRLCIEGLQEMAGTKGVKNRAKLIKTIKSLSNIDVVTRPQDKELEYEEKKHEEEEKVEISNVNHPATTCN